LIEKRHAHIEYRHGAKALRHTFPPQGDTQNLEI